MANEAKCPCCGQGFAFRKGKIYCSDKCRREASRGCGRDRAAERRKPGAVRKRSCHDCGKPTFDYRCASCLAKWRQKHGVPKWEREEEGL